MIDSFKITIDIMGLRISHKCDATTNFLYKFLTLLLSFGLTHELTQNCPFDCFGDLGILFATNHCLTVYYSA